MKSILTLAALMLLGLTTAEARYNPAAPADTLRELHIAKGREVKAVIRVGDEVELTTDKAGSPGAYGTCCSPIGGLIGSLSKSDREFKGYVTRITATEVYVGSRAVPIKHLKAIRSESDLPAENWIGGIFLFIGAGVSGLAGLTAVAYAALYALIISTCGTADGIDEQTVWILLLAGLGLFVLALVLLSQAIRLLDGRTYKRSRGWQFRSVKVE